MFKDLRLGDTFEICINGKKYAGVCVTEVASIEDVSKYDRKLGYADIKFYPIIAPKGLLICLDNDSINGNTRVVLTEKSLKNTSESNVYSAFFEMRSRNRKDVAIKSGIDMFYNSSKTFNFPGIPKGNIATL
jgi:hypothetical protein